MKGFHFLGSGSAVQMPSRKVKNINQVKGRLNNRTVIIVLRLANRVWRTNSVAQGRFRETDARAGGPDKGGRGGADGTERAPECVEARDAQ